MIRRATRERPAPPPLALPQVEVTVPDGGPITVTVDGVRLESATPIERSTLRPRLAELARLRNEPLQVRIHEDGRPPFADIVRPTGTAAPGSGESRPTSAGPPTPDAAAQTETPSDAEAFRVSDDGVVVGLAGDGFLPGEHVAFAVIVTLRAANDDGTASLFLPTALLARRPGQFVLYGQTSRKVVLADPFGGDQR